MFTAVAICWLVGSSLLLAWVVLARRRRGALARELHELRGALTSARLAVDLLPVLALDRPSVCRAASDELERTHATLADFEQLLHERLIAPSITRERISEVTIARGSRAARFDARTELVRLTTIWAAAAAREGRSLDFEWVGQPGEMLVSGPRRRFAEVLTNLLANAVRHGEGRISVVARVRSDSLRIEVADEGRGLPGPLARIARRPQRGEHGHGLAVARAGARRLGGTLASAPSSGGARLAFTVPALHRPQLETELAGAEDVGE